MSGYDLRDASGVDEMLDALATGDDIYATEAPCVPLRMAGESRAAQALHNFERKTLPLERSALHILAAERPGTPHPSFGACSASSQNSGAVPAGSRDRS